MIDTPDGWLDDEPTRAARRARVDARFPKYPPVETSGPLRPVPFQPGVYFIEGYLVPDYGPHIILSIALAAWALFMAVVYW